MTNYNIFTCPIWKSKINYIHKKELIKEIEKNYEKQPNLKPNGWKCNLHTSFTYKEEENFLVNEHETLLRDIRNKLEEFVCIHNLKMNLEGNFIMSNIWYNAYMNNQFQEPHDHSGSIFSGCYYLKFNKNKHYQTKFYNPNYNLDHIKLENNPYFCFTPNCEEDDLIIFPSMIKHGTQGVKENCDEMRITISFNVKNENIVNSKSIFNKVLYQ